MIPFTSRRQSSLSYITKSFPYQSFSINILRKKAAVEWNVPIIGSLGSRKGFTQWGLSPSFVAIRSRISRAALLVKVTQKIDRGSIPFSCIIETTRSVMVWVFPDQAQALMRSGPSIVWTASNCFWLSWDMGDECSEKKEKVERKLAFPVVSYILAHSILSLFNQNRGSRKTFWLAFASETSWKTCYRRCGFTFEYWFFYSWTLSRRWWADQCSSSWAHQSWGSWNTEVLWTK